MSYIFTIESFASHAHRKRRQAIGEEAIGRGGGRWGREIEEASRSAVVVTEQALADGGDMIRSGAKRAVQ